MISPLTNYVTTTEQTWNILHYLTKNGIRDAYSNLTPLLSVKGLIVSSYFSIYSSSIRKSIHLYATGLGCPSCPLLVKGPFC